MQNNIFLNKELTLIKKMLKHHIITQNYVDNLEYLAHKSGLTD